MRDIVREQSVHAHVALTRLSLDLSADPGTVRSAGDNHEASQHRIRKRQGLDAQRYESAQYRAGPLIAYCHQKRK